MGAWCDVPLAKNEIDYANEIVRSVLVECTVEFARHIDKPFGEGAEANWLALFEQTIGRGLQNGAKWSPVNRAWVLRFVGRVGKEAAHLTTECGESRITGQRLSQAVSIVIEHARKVEARISA
jgi:hypothetical protein